MVGKRRPHKTPVVYKKVVGAGISEAGPPALEKLALERASNGGGDSQDEDDATEDEESAASRLFRDFPLELIDLICSMTPKKFHLLFVNRRWHAMVLPHIYGFPQLTSANFALFVNSISDNRFLGSFVRELDLVKIAQVGKNSMVSRLLRRCSPRLEKFNAPQSNFGYAPMISLAACVRLRELDLSLVSETVDLPQLFKTIQSFHDLEVLHFPRSSLECGKSSEVHWPPNLRQLGLSGGFPSAFIERMSFPAGLTELQISNCPYMNTQALLSLFRKIGPQLRRLAVYYPMPRLSSDALDTVFISCPNLRTLRVSVDYVTSLVLDEQMIPTNHPLKSLTLASSGLMGHSDKIRPGDVLLATDYLTHLTRICTSFQLGWNPESSALMGLVDVMNERGGGVWMA